MLRTILLGISALLVFLIIAWAFFMLIYLLKGREEINKEKGLKNNQFTYPKKISIIIPAKNEGKSLNRLLERLVNSDYPNYEIILVEGGSDDQTPDICGRYKGEYPDIIKLVRGGDEGKPAALNLGLEETTGEIIGVLDADSFPVEENFLYEISAEFEDDEVTAVQGKISLIEPDRSLSSRLSNFSRYLPLPYIMKGKKRIDGFVPLFGTHQYVKKSFIEEIGGWDEDALTEDIDLSLELNIRGKEIRYSLAEMLEEPPASFKSFLEQNTRHARGMLQALFKHIKGLNFLSISGWDALLTLFSPILVSLGFIGFIMALSIIPFLLRPDLMLFILILSLISSSVGLVRSKYSEDSKISYAPWLFILWAVQSGIGIFAFVAEVVGLPRVWKRTEKEISKSFNKL